MGRVYRGADSQGDAMSNPNSTSVSDFTVKCSGDEISSEYLVSFIVEMDLGQPDMCTIVVRNEDNSYSNNINLADEMKVTSGSETVFSGEVVGVEPEYKASGSNTVTIRGFNKMHRLSRGTKARTYVQMTDADIVNRVATDNGLSVQCGDLAREIPHEHVFQHNQSDLQFLRRRAARLGYEVWVTGDELYFDIPRTDGSPSITLRYGDAEEIAKENRPDLVFLKHFTPRISSSGVVQNVEVRSWDPAAKQEIVKNVTPEVIGSRLGSKKAHEAASGFGSQVTSFEVGSPVYSPREAELMAGGQIAAASMSYMTGEGECRGLPTIKPGVIVGINVSQAGDERFNGNYVVVGTTHKYTPSKSSNTDGYVTRFRVRRDAEG
jgi:phage protein D